MWSIQSTGVILWINLNLDKLWHTFRIKGLCTHRFLISNVKATLWTATCQIHWKAVISTNKTVWWNINTCISSYSLERKILQNKSINVNSLWCNYSTQGYFWSVLFFKREIIYLLSAIKFLVWFYPLTQDESVKMKSARSYG